MRYLVYVLIFDLGWLVGMMFHVWIKGKRAYEGSIVVTREGSKLIYTLVVNDDPEKIEHRKDILFKVVTPEEDLIRE